MHSELHEMECSGNIFEIFKKIEINIYAGAGK